MKQPAFMKKTITRLIRKRPDLLFYGGIAAIVTGTVAACVATVKAKDAVDDMHETLDDLREKKDEMTKEEYDKEVTHTYIHTGVKLMKYYVGPFSLELAGIYMLNKSHGELKDNVASLGAALTANIKDFKEYRKAVVNKDGKEADEFYKFGICDEEIVEIDEEGAESHRSVRRMDPNLPGYSIYARMFDDGCKGWTKNPEENLAWLMNLQMILTDKLRSDKFLFLNDVYEALGIPKTVIGQQVGWIYGKGDGYVDFGIHDIYSLPKDFRKPKCDFINGYERTVLLDFNVDGYILDEFGDVAYYGL